ncbi:endonuclease/exonuclease/phosphatase family protein [Nocardiopsis aegyptia]|uniref:Vancomycin resistance protein VanJ n=1 Tax=Nocardiopsis aegyptia TaxID=220378 RepID=A0A7Z0EM45_9ACTN|nr:endonuclease/exonuclease/phosphatase family protein [Nocardiopsis aegyptia]NYJ34642.1 vancomycin resistance protein VanJ [Nocardiopsis aegyptia]
MTPTLRPERTTPGWGRRPDRADLVLAAAALLLGLLMALHAWIPNRIGGLGSLVETFLPWFGLLVPVLLAGALWRRSGSAAAALLVPAVVWLGLFGGQLADTSGTDGGLTVVSHNVGAGNPDPAGTARDLAASGADVLALQEVAADARGTYERELAQAYPHHTIVGTVGLWSRTPLSDARPVDTRMDVGPLGEAKPAEATRGYNRALRATVATDEGPLAVYVAHLGSVRVLPRGGFRTDDRDRGAQALAEAVAAEPHERVVLLGDLNGAMDDRAFDALTAHLTPVQDRAGGGFGFTWPAGFPVVRLDQILVRGVEVDDSWVLPATGSDHRPVAAGLG